MELKNTQILITKNKKSNKKHKGYSIQIWIDKISSWLVFDNFKSLKQAKEFLADKKEIAEVKRYIKKVIKGDTALKEKNARNKSKGVKR